MHWRTDVSYALSARTYECIKQANAWVQPLAEAKPKASRLDAVLGGGLGSLMSQMLLYERYAKTPM
jgi:hypothetical protein